MGSELSAIILGDVRRREKAEMTREQREDTIYNAAQLAEIERISLTRQDYRNIIDCAEEFLYTTGHYDYDDCYFVITEYFNIFS